VSDTLFPDQFNFDGDETELAHCRSCWEPMYCIYGSYLRDFCYACGCASGIPEDSRVFPFDLFVV